MTILDLIKKCALMLKIDRVLEDESLKDVSYSNENSVLSNNEELQRLFEFAKMVIDEVNNYSPNIFQYTGQTKNTTSDTHEDYVNNLKAVAAYQGISIGLIDELLEDGVTPEEIEEYIYEFAYG